MANPENLIPYQVKPGQVLNPTGVNQFTYRRQAEAQFSERLKKNFRKNVSVSEQIIRRVLEDACAGKPHAQKLVLERVLPAIQEHDVSISEASGAGTILDKLTRIVELKRANGGDREPEPERADGGNGDIP